MRIVGWLALVAFMVSCAPIQPQPKPYEGLSKNSYGTLSNNSLQICDPSLAEGQANGTSDLAIYITSKIVSPTQGALTSDPALEQENLQDQFKITADTGSATVVLLSRNSKEIVFWYNFPLVSLDEITNASKKYCRKMKKTPVYEGSAQRCGDKFAIPLTFNGRQISSIPTQTISAFLCR